MIETLYAILFVTLITLGWMIGEQLAQRWAAAGAFERLAALTPGDMLIMIGGLLFVLAAMWLMGRMARTLNGKR